MACATPSSDNNADVECLQDQTDEVELLKSMFPEEDRINVIDSPDSLLEDSQKLYSLLLNVHVKVDGPVTVNAWAPFDDDVKLAAKEAPPNTKPTFERSLSGRRWHCSFELKHLTPISLHVILPPSYPASCPPDITMSCLWLSPSQLQCLCQQLDGLWGEASNMPVLYTWIDWLEHNTFSHLALSDAVILTPYIAEEDDTPVDARAISECVDLENDIGLMLRHDLTQEIITFQQENHLCEICFDEKPGIECVLLIECRHSFCQDCLKEMVAMNVKEGTVQHLNCPGSKCESSLPPDVIRSLLSEEEFDRWERLLLQKTLDSMGCIEYCPRCNNMGIVDEQVELNLAICTECNFSFCTLCKETWHQGSGCFGQLPVNGKANQKKVDKERKKNLADLRMSNAFIKSTSKRCPNCRVPIYKFDGCNKVVCTQCRSFMCWVCGNMIRGYDHFSKSCDLFFRSTAEPGSHQAPRELPERAQEINDRLMTDPKARRLVIPCPRCRQKSLKEDRNNHLQCWACKTNFCAMCRKRIEGSLSRHYMAGTACVQHSDDLLVPS